jgi:hypothetical protein
VRLGLALAPSSRCRPTAVAAVSIVFVSTLVFFVVAVAKGRHNKGQQTNNKQHNHGSNFLPRMGAHGKERWNVVEKMEWQKRTGRDDNDDFWTMILLLLLRHHQ